MQRGLDGVMAFLNEVGMQISTEKSPQTWLTHITEKVC